jgi:hypothetical protein
MVSDSMCYTCIRGETSIFAAYSIPASATQTVSTSDDCRRALSDLHSARIKCAECSYSSKIPAAVRPSDKVGGLRRSRARDLPQRFRACTALAAVLVLCAAQAASAAEWLIDADAGAIFDSNLTHAASAPDIRPDWAATVDASVGQFFALSGNDGLTLAVNVRGEAYDRYKGLNLAAIGASARYRHKFGLGRDAPSASLVVNGLYGDYQSAVRNGARFDLRAELGERLTESIDAIVGVGYDRRYGPDGEAVVPGFSGEVFSLAGQSAYFQISYAIDEQWLLSVNGAIRRGDVESTSQQGLAVFLASSAIAEDPAFNDPNLFAYRLRGTTSTLGATSSFALNDRASLNVQYAYAFTDSPQNLKYRSYITGLVYAHRF